MADINLILDTDKIVAPEGTISITSNSSDIDVAKYAKASVNVPNPSTGTLNIPANGIYDVTQYANADVNVSGGGGIETATIQAKIATNGYYATIINAVDQFGVLQQDITTFGSQFQDVTIPKPSTTGSKYYPLVIKPKDAANDKITGVTGNTGGTAIKMSNGQYVVPVYAGDQITITVVADS